MDISVTMAEESSKRPKPKDDSQLGFGIHFSDHMFLLDYHPIFGWQHPRILPYGPLSIEPSAAIFHYAQQVFEGFKAYKGPLAEIKLFLLTRFICICNTILPNDQITILRDLFQDAEMLPDNNISIQGIVSSNSRAARQASNIHPEHENSFLTNGGAPLMTISPLQE